MGNSNHIENGEEQLKKRILEVSSAFSVPNRVSRDNAWAIFENSASAETPVGKQVQFVFSYALKIAATFLLIAIATFTLYTFQQVEIHTANGEFKTITLPDQSTVLLNAASSLEYNAMTFRFSRKLTFSGEGFFKVRKGSKFSVVSEGGVVQVMGTQFNVLARKNTYEVSCVEGKVRVHTDYSSVILTAGLHTFRLSDQKLENPKTFKEEITAWQQGEFYFDAEPLQHVLTTLEHQYNVAIEFKGDSARTYTGYFTNRNLDEALKLVCLPLGLEYQTFDQKQITISNKK